MRVFQRCAGLRRHARSAHGRQGSRARISPSSGFDDIAEATLWRPALTSLGISREELGRRMVELLLRRLAEPDAPAKRIILDFELKSRETVRVIHA